MITIIIISYNTKDLITKCLDSLLNEIDISRCEIIVFDNASTDGSPDEISLKFPEIKLIKSSKNHGFALANNIASEHANGEYLLLLNPDTVVLEGAIKKLMGFAEIYSEYQIYGGRTLYADLSLNPTSCWGRQTLWSLFCFAFGLSAIFKKSSFFAAESLGGWARDTVKEVDIVSGCFFLINKSLWDQLGGFDSKFFMYGEEVDLCLRARNFGARPVVCPEATIIHYGGASEPIRAEKSVRLFKAKVELIKRHWSPAFIPMGLLFFKIGCFLRWLVLATFSVVKREHVHSAENWLEIWQRRKEWEIGYP